MTRAHSRGVRKRGSVRRVPSASSKTNRAESEVAVWQDEVSVGATPSRRISRAAAARPDLAQNSGVCTLAHCSCEIEASSTASLSAGSKMSRTRCVARPPASGGAKGGTLRSLRKPTKYSRLRDWGTQPRAFTKCQVTS